MTNTRQNLVQFIDSPNTASETKSGVNVKYSAFKVVVITLLLAAFATVMQPYVSRLVFSALAAAVTLLGAPDPRR